MSQAGGNSGGGGGGSSILTLTGNDNVAVTPTNGNVFLLGEVVANGSNDAGIYTELTDASTESIEVQLAAAIPTTNVANVGLAAFDSGSFAVDANGFVTLTGDGPGSVTFTGDMGTPFTTSSVLFSTGQASNLQGATIGFRANTGSTMALDVSDANYNVAIGYNSGTPGMAANGAFYNTFLGVATGQNITDGQANCALGTGALYDVGGASGNCAVGQNSLFQTTGNNNVAIGYQAGQNLGTGATNVLIGLNAMRSATGNATQNVALGEEALITCTDGNYNFVVATTYGTNYTSTESNNILLVHPGVVGESNVMRLGAQGSGIGQVDTAFMAGIVGSTVAGTPVYIDSDGQLGNASSLPSQTYVQVNDIDFTSAAATLLYTPASGYNFMLSNVYVYYTSVSGSVSDALISLGQNSPTYDNWFNGWWTQSTSAPAVGIFSNYSLAGDTSTQQSPFATNDVPLYMNIITPAVATTAIGTIIVEGILLSQ